MKDYFTVPTACTDRMQRFFHKLPLVSRKTLFAHTSVHAHLNLKKDIHGSRLTCFLPTHMTARSVPTNLQININVHLGPASTTGQNPLTILRKEMQGLQLGMLNQRKTCRCRRRLNHPFCWALFSSRLI